MLLASTSADRGVHLSRAAPRPLDYSSHSVSTDIILVQRSDNPAEPSIRLATRVSFTRVVVTLIEVFDMNARAAATVPGLTTYSSLGEVTWTRTSHDLDFRTGLDDAFMELYKRVVFAKRSTLMRIDEVDFPRLGGGSLMGTSHILRVDDDDPGNFTLMNFGERTSVAGGGNYLGKSLSSVPLPGFRRSVQDTYQVAKQNRRPLLSEIRTHQGGRFSEYRRLVIPLTSHRHEVTDLLISCISFAAPGPI
jgi:hypothetical protein